MPILLDIPANDVDALLEQLGEFRTVSNTLDKLAAHLTDVANEIARAQGWVKKLGPEYEELRKFLATQQSTMYHSVHRMNVISQSFEETWDIGQALARALAKPKHENGIKPVLALPELWGNPPSDEELEDLQNGRS